MYLKAFRWATLGMKSIVEYSNRIVCNMVGHLTNEADPMCVVPSVSFMDCMCNMTQHRLLFEMQGIHWRLHKIAGFAILEVNKEHLRIQKP